MNNCRCCDTNCLLLTIVSISLNIRDTAISYTKWAQYIVLKRIESNILSMTRNLLTFVFPCHLWFKPDFWHSYSFSLLWKWNNRIAFRDKYVNGDIRMCTPVWSGRGPSDSVLYIKNSDGVTQSYIFVLVADRNTKSVLHLRVHFTLVVV